MKQFLVAVVCLLTLLPIARAQREADERYIAIYGLIQQALGQAEIGEPRQALVSLTAAQAQLVQFQKVYPSWYPIIVNFRLGDLAKKITTTSAKVAALPPPPAESTNAVAAAPPPKVSAQEESLRAQLQAMQTENQTLQAKLKEALSSQPAPVDSGELAKAQEEIRSLMKLNDLLKASAAVDKNTNGVASLRRQLSNALDKYSVEHGRAEKLAADSAALQGELKRVAQDASAIESLRHENERLKSQLAAPSAVADDKKSAKAQAAQLKAANRQIASLQAALTKNADEIAAVRRQLTEAHDKNSAEQARREKLAVDNTALQRELKQAGPDVKAIEALRRENALLKSRLSAPPPVATDKASAKELAAQLKALNAQVASLQSTVKVVTLEKGALENKVRQLSAEADQMRAANVQGQIRDLIKQRDELARQLARAGKKKSFKNEDPQVAALTNELASLRARIEVAEAKPVPYTSEELALFRDGASPPKPAQHSIKELPSGTSQLVVSAQQHFAKHEFDAAEADYQKILERDQNNGLVLANLATIELQENKLADAEKHITAALTQSPDDPYNLSTIGYLKFRQEKYDEALDNLSRAAKLDPNNPEIQNYLGVTLSHKGLRVEAETALRKAVQLNPLYAPAHNNLAVVYLNQTPPMPMLARWHYEKAVAAGQPRNPDLEHLLADKGAPVQLPQ